MVARLRRLQFRVDYPPVTRATSNRLLAQRCPLRIAGSLRPEFSTYPRGPHSPAPGISGRQTPGLDATLGRP